MNVVVKVFFDPWNKKWTFSVRQATKRREFIAMGNLYITEEAAERAAKRQARKNGWKIESFGEAA